MVKEVAHSPLAPLDTTNLGSIVYTFGRLEADVRLVLSGVIRPWSVPAEVLTEVIAQQGWTMIHSGALREGQLVACDAWRNRLILHIELTCPKMRNWLLAMQLGEIRLNYPPILAGKRRPASEEEITEYAIAYLVPEKSLRAHPLLQWKAAPQKVAEQLANHFQVPVACLQAALDHYRLSLAPDTPLPPGGIIQSIRAALLREGFARY